MVEPKEKPSLGEMLRRFLWVRLMVSAARQPTLR